MAVKLTIETFPSPDKNFWQLELPPYHKVGIATNYPEMTRDVVIFCDNPKKAAYVACVLLQNIDKKPTGAIEL